jgi:hypothetical protein
LQWFEGEFASFLKVGAVCEPPFLIQTRFQKLKAFSGWPFYFPSGFFTTLRFFQNDNQVAVILSDSKESHFN